MQWRWKPCQQLITKVCKEFISHWVNLYVSREHCLCICWKDALKCRVAKGHMTWPYCCRDMSWLCLSLLMGSDSCFCAVMLFCSIALFRAPAFAFISQTTVWRVLLISEASMLSPHCSVAPTTVMRKVKLWYWHTLTYSRGHSFLFTC